MCLHEITSMLILKFQFTKMNSPTFTFLNIVVQDVKWEQCMVKMGRCMLQNLVHHIEQDEVKLEILFQNEIGSIIELLFLVCMPSEWQVQ